MAQYVVLWDDTSGRYINSKQAYGPSSTIDEDFDVGVGGQSVFQLLTDISSASRIEVFVNGRLQREGALHDFTRDNDNDQIVFNYTVGQTAWVRVTIR